MHSQCPTTGLEVIARIVGLISISPIIVPPAFARVSVCSFCSSNLLVQFMFYLISQHLCCDVRGQLLCREAVAAGSILLPCWIYCIDLVSGFPIQYFCMFLTSWFLGFFFVRVLDLEPGLFFF